MHVGRPTLGVLVLTIELRQTASILSAQHVLQSLCIFPLTPLALRLVRPYASSACVSGNMFCSLSRQSLGKLLS